jgi:phosphotransferase system enzyme I (PtsI)
MSSLQQRPCSLWITGAEGIGLYRTEFLFIDRARLPTEDEQYEQLRIVVEAMAPRPVTLRTFDIGGDKFASSFQLPSEMNPALGLRAVRLALERPDVFHVHLRAMLRASVHGSVRVMVPMVASVQEMREVRRALLRARASLVAEGHAIPADIPLGMMIEVPSAVFLADLFTHEAEFFSIGTNDLIQYCLAVDRTNRKLAPMASPFHPAVARMVRQVVAAARGAGLSVSVCGAMASDPYRGSDACRLGCTRAVHGRRQLFPRSKKRCGGSRGRRAKSSRPK